MLLPCNEELLYAPANAGKTDLMAKFLADNDYFRLNFKEDGRFFRLRTLRRRPRAGQTRASHWNREDWIRSDEATLFPKRTGDAG